MRDSEDTSFWKQSETNLNLLGKEIRKELSESLNYETQNRLQEALRLVNQNKNEPRAHYLLGVHYQNGWGINKNAALARNHYEAAVELGHAGACYELVLAYLNGNTEMGIKKSYDKVKYYLNKVNSRVEDEQIFDDVNYQQKNYVAQLKDITEAITILQKDDLENVASNKHVENEPIKKNTYPKMQSVKQTEIFDKPITTQLIKESTMEREDKLRNTIKKQGEEQPQKTGLPPIPPEWKCPITGEIMFDPVIVPVSGRSYEREALEQWLQTHNTDPQTNQVIPQNSYFSNQGLQSTIVQFAKFIPGMWEEGEETIYKSEHHRDNVWNAANSGDEKELSRWLELDPRVVYEEKNSTTLLEFLSSDKKRIACIQRVIGHAEHNPLGGFERLRKIIKDSKTLFFNLAKCDGPEQTIAYTMIKKLSPIMEWNEKIYLGYYFEACEKGLVNTLPAFITLNIPLDSYDEKGRTALHLAVANNQIPVVQWLFNSINGKKLFIFLLTQQKNADVDSRKTIFEMLNPQDQLAKVIKNMLGDEREYEMFAYIISHITTFNSQLKILALALSWDSSFYQNAAKQAALSGASSILEKSLELGANVNYSYPEKEGKTLLHLAAIFSSNLMELPSQNHSVHQELLQLLLVLSKFDASINAKDNSGKTVLHTAIIQRADESFIQSLLACADMDIWISDNEGKIVIEYLLDPVIRKGLNLTLLANAYDKEKLFEYLLSKYPLDEKLRAFFAELKWDEKLYQHCAFKFAEKGQKDLLQTCLDLGVKSDAQGKKSPYEGQYLLATAIIGGLECVKLLLVRRANINVRAQHNNTMLHEAVRHQKLEIAYELLERGLGINNRKGKAENAQEQTAEEYAEHLGYMQLANAIRERRKQIKYRPFIKQETQALEQKIKTLEDESKEFKKQKRTFAPLFQMYKADKKLLRLMNIGTHNDDIYALLVHPKGYLISGGIDCVIKLWDMNDYTCLSVLKDHKGCITKLALIQEAQYLVSTSTDKTIKIWNLKDPKNVLCTATLMWHDAHIYAIAELPNKHLVSGAGNNTIKIWDLNNLNAPQCVSTLVLDSSFSAVDALIALPLGKYNSIYFICGIGNEIKIFDATNLEWPKCVTTLKAHGGSIRDFKLIGNQLISASSDKTIKIWDISDLNSLKLIATLEGHKDDVTRLAELPNGYLASGSTDKTIKTWDLNTKNCIATLEGQQKIWALATTLDGNIVTGEAKNTDQDNKPAFNIQLWSRAQFMPVIEEIEQAIPECKQM